MVFGAPYAPLGHERIANMMKVLQIKPGEKAVDIGSGDGRIVIELARQGAEAHGYEINPLLVLISRRNIRKAGLQGKAFIHRADMWQQDYSGFSAITLYTTTHAMGRLEKKLRKDVNPGTRIAANYFKFPNWQPIKKEGTVYLYIR